eukprot:TRINITY_DN4763_c0_g1_i9.p1 TRINITY_DN4763_c0_g1~~TRINITY_DN4763_c0_g1_i9.p1  ORF type:complete len:431 (+),score=117.30 TRINITY_DN4763_c0_g1_i9:1365-2657(+)
MTYGVYTEKGVELFVPIILAPASSARELPLEIQELNKCLSQLEGYFERHNGGISDVNVLSVCQSAVNFLKKPKTTGLRSFFYENDSTLTQARKILLSLGDYVIRIGRHLENESVNQLGGKVLQLLFSRKELALVMNKCPEYFPSLWGLLELAFNYLETNSEAHDKYISFALTLAYYNFPCFRNELLRLCTPNKQANFKVTPAQSSLANRIFNNTDTHFGKIKAANWLGMLSDSQDLLFNFMTSWMKYTGRMVTEIGNVTWNEVMGYDIIVAFVLHKLQTIDMAGYSTPFKRVTESLLVNRGLLNTMMKTIFGKCSPYDIKLVDKTLEMFVWWINLLVHNGKKPFDYDFDFDFFQKAIAMMLKMNSLYTGYKCLVMLYNVLVHIPEDERAMIIKENLLNDNFYDYFYHWSYYYRHLFQLIMLYHIYKLVNE